MRRRRGHKARERGRKRRTGTHISHNQIQYQRKIILKCPFFFLQQIKWPPELPSAVTFSLSDRPSCVCTADSSCSQWLSLLARLLDPSNYEMIPETTPQKCPKAALPAAQQCVLSWTDLLRLCWLIILRIEVYFCGVYVFITPCTLCCPPFLLVSPRNNVGDRPWDLWSFTRTSLLTLHKHGRSVFTTQVRHAHTQPNIIH